VPKVLDETPAGEPVVEVRGVRLVLREHATFFNRLVPCSTCGRETPGVAVRTPADLDAPPGPATCRECRRATAAPAPVPAQAPPPAPVADTAGPAIEALAARVDEVQAALAEQAARAVPPPELAALGKRLDKLEAGTGGADVAPELAALGKRLDKLETKGRTTAAEAGRVEAMERRVEQLAALMAERESRLEEVLAKTLAAAEAAAAKVEARVRAVESRVEETTGEMGELGDLHAALDVGLGQLRSDLAAVRDNQRDLSLLQDEFDRRLETVAAIQRAVTAAEEGKGRRGGKKAAEFTTQLAAAQVATDELAKEQKQLRAQLSVIELATDRAADTASKAWAQVATISPLRMGLDDLEERLEIQNEALAALTDTVQSLLRSGPAAKPAASKAPAPKPAAAKPPAAKAPAASKAARTTKSAAPRK
jgi:tetrahydromethanopterin S-methyltransferase subunit G